MTLNEFKRFNKDQGFHWFSPDTMRFFKTKIASWDGETGYFITSEINPSGHKAYSIRKADFETGNVNTVGTFMQYPTLAKAKSALTKLLK